MSLSHPTPTFEASVSRASAPAYDSASALTEPWYLLNFIAPACRRSEILDARVRTYNAIHGTDLRVFAPQVVEAQPSPDGGIRIVNRAILYHYIFLQGPLPHVKRFCSEGDGLSFVLRHADAGNEKSRIKNEKLMTGCVSQKERSLQGSPIAEDADDHRREALSPRGARAPLPAESQRYVSISNEEIEAFRIIARAYSNRLPYYRPSDIDLLDGDEVEVVSGPFAGLRGTFLARRGTRDGHIVVSATSQLGSIAYNIKADTIRILRFSKDSRRAYDQIDAFLPKLREALALHRADQPLTPAQAAPLHIFTRRFAVTQIPGAKLDAKLQAMLAVANEILGNREAAAEARARYERRLPHVTNPATLALLNELMNND